MQLALTYNKLTLTYNKLALTYKLWMNNSPANGPDLCTCESREVMPFVDASPCEGT